MNKIINQAPLVLYMPSASKKFFLIFGTVLFQQNRLLCLTPLFLPFDQVSAGNKVVIKTRFPLVSLQLRIEESHDGR